MKFVIPLVLIAAAVSVAWVIAPSYVSSDMEASATVQNSHVGADGEAMRAKPDEVQMSNVSSIEVAQAEAAGSADQENRAAATEDGLPENAAAVADKGDPGLLSKEAHTLLNVDSAKARPVLGCLIEPDQTAEIGSPVVGVISSINIERGERVKRGQVLARLRSNVERASVEVAQARTQAEADVRAAQTNLEFLRQKQARAEGLVAKNFISQQALEQARADTRLAEEKLAQSLEQQQIWQRELELANAQLQLRSIRAPFDGLIVDRYVSVGERIEEKPLFRIVKTDPLRVEMVAPATMFGTVAAGTVVKVMPDLPNMPALPAQVVLVDTFIDGASNTFRVRASLSNSDGALPSGLRCRAELSDLPVAAAATPSAVSRRARTSPSLRMALKVDASPASLQRETTAVALPAKP